MVSHLTEMQLDLYLDNGLDPQERQFVQAHLAACAACQQRLAVMRPLFQALEGLAVPISAGFAREVIGYVEASNVSTGREQRRLPWPMLILEGTTSLVLLAILIGRFGDLIPQPPAGWLSTAVDRLATALQSGSEAFDQIVTSLLAELPQRAASLPDLLPFQLTTLQIGAVMTAATAALFVGNILLLRGDIFNNNSSH